MKSRQLVRLVSASLLAFLASQARANVLTVGGANGMFSDIQSAVNAASDGDVILVRPGTYHHGFSVGGKSLFIAADPAGSVTTGPITVSGLGAAQRCSISGIAARGTVASVTAFNAHDSQGALRLQSMTFNDPPVFGTVHGATLANCGNVAFAGCTLFGQPTGPTGNTSGAGLESQNSSIALYDDSIQGAPGHDGFVDALPESPGFGGPGCLLVNGNLFASGSTVHGGDGGSGSPASCSPGPFPGGDALPGATGIYGFPATILDSIVTGGHGGQGGAAAPACGMPGGSSAADGFDFLFPATVLAGQHKTLTAPTLVRELHTLDLQVAGNAGDNVWLSTSNGASWRLSPARRGVVLLSQPSDVSFLGTVPANGMLRASVPIGDLGPGVQDRPLFLQATCIDGAGHVTLTGPAVVVLLDQMF